jgi:hypothetical protein
MHPKKLEFSHDVTHIVCDMCKLVYNLNSANEINKVLGVTRDEAKAIIGKIIDALPDSIFERAYPKLLDDIKNICAREFIFFQIQEKCNDPRYQDDLKMFIHVFSRDIQKRINSQAEYQTTKEK